MGLWAYDRVLRNSSAHSLCNDLSTKWVSTEIQWCFWYKNLSKWTKSLIKLTFPSSPWLFLNLVLIILLMRKLSGLTVPSSFPICIKVYHVKGNDVTCGTWCLWASIAHWNSQCLQISQGCTQNILFRKAAINPLYPFLKGYTPLVITLSIILQKQSLVSNKL